MTTIALSPFVPYARLIRMSDNAVRATTHLLLSGTSRTSRLDAAGACSAVFSLSDPGDASAADISGGKLGWSATLLQAAGGAGVGVPVPMLLSVSLDGGASYDFHRLVQKPLRDSDPTRLTLTESGEDIFTLYGQIPAGGGRLTLAGCKLVDVLGAEPGSIIPLVDFRGFISTDNKVPFAGGLLWPASSIFQDIPGNTAWDAGALALLRFVAVVATEGFTTAEDLAFNLPTTLDSWSDNQQHAIAVLCEILGAVVLAGDTATLGSRGHYVADCSDHALNVAGTFAGCVADGTPTAGSLGGTYGLSNARTGGHEVSRSVVIGSVGAPSGLLFTDTPSSLILDETAEALILTNKATIEPDLTVLHGACSFDGGSSDAGFPAGGTITALTQVNRIPSGDRDSFTDCKCFLGINVSEKTGGAYYWDDLGSLIPLNLAQSIAVLDMTVDTVNNLIYIATPHGVYSRTDDITDTTAPWVQVGGLSARVVRLCGVATSEPDFIIYAQVQDTTNPNLDGIYVYDTGAAISNLGYDGWIQKHPSPNVVDVQSTDATSFFYIDKTAQSSVFYRDDTGTGAIHRFALPTGVFALRLDRVLATSQDTVFITTTGAADPVTMNVEAGYYLSFDGSSWITNGLKPALLAVNQSLQVNRWVGPNTVINIDTSAMTIRLVACTANGLYVSTTNTPTLSSDWIEANQQNGLAGVAITNMSAGQYQTILGVNTSRVYACTSQALYASGNSGDQFDDVTRMPVDLGPYFKDLVVHGTGGTGTGAAPSNSVQTVGPMASSPLGLASGTHVQVTSYKSFPTLPSTWYYWRRLNQRGAFEWRLINPDCPFSALQKDQLTDVIADETQDTLTASSIVAAVSRRWLGENSTENTILHLPSSFTQTTAALRKLQCGQLVNVTMSGTIPQRSSTGDIISSAWADFDNEPFFVLDGHQWTLPSPGANYCETLTPVGKILRSSGLTPQSMATSLQRQLNDMKRRVSGRRKGQ